jgi:formate-dependent phosphoribosylglycinamide formyltransferase (GAR transformylase)
MVDVGENIDAKGFQATPAVEYSNYCKKRIGIRDTSDEEIVEMCPQILFGPREQFKTIVERLRALPKIGFPLVVNKEKIQSIGGRN